MKAQEQNKELLFLKNNEIKTNGKYLALEYYNLGYENLLNKNLSTGVSIYSKKNDDFQNNIYNINTRYCFGKSIFFCEAAFLFYKKHIDYKQYSQLRFSSIFSSGIGCKQFIIRDIFIYAFISSIVFDHVVLFYNKTSIPTHAGLSLVIRF